MDQSEERELYRRINQLENDITEIREMLRQLAPDSTAPTPPSEPIARPKSPQPTPDSAPPPPPPLPRRPPRPEPTPPIFKPAPKPPDSSGWKLPAHMRTGEFWLKVVGIGLILFGVAFAFKYSIDQGWINPLVRHLFGLAIGIALSLFGVRLYGRRPGFAQVLLGGSIGVFYITCFSAFQLFQLISHPDAFGPMIVISVGSFWIAIRQDKALFSLIGTTGALGTPFLLYTGSGNLPGLVLYTCLVLISTTAVFFFRGWRLLLWFSVLGSWIVLAIGIEGGRLDTSRGLNTDRWAMQAGLIVAWLTFWLAPVGRQIATIKAPSKWKLGRLGIGDSDLAEGTRKVLNRHVHLLSMGPVLVALLLSILTWPDLERHFFGWATMGAASLYVLVALYLRNIEFLPRLSSTASRSNS